jgi:Flp pilus assembly protein TadD
MARRSLAYGEIANGYHGLNQFDKAEGFYKKCLEIWNHGVPGSPQICVSNMATCLWLQGKLEEAESYARSIITDWNDKSSYQ